MSRDRDSQRPAADSNPGITRLHTRSVWGLKVGGGARGLEGSWERWGGGIRGYIDHGVCTGEGYRRRRQQVMLWLMLLMLNMLSNGSRCELLRVSALEH